MLISETEYRYQVEQDIKPFRDVLLGLFFVTIGMQLDLRGGALLDLGACCTLAILLAVKIRADHRRCRRLFGSDAGTAIRTGLALGAGGEFGLVLLFAGRRRRSCSPPQVQQIVLAAMMLSMLAAPFIIERSEHMVRRFSGADWMNRAMALHDHRGADHGGGAARASSAATGAAARIWRACSSRRTSPSSRSTSIRSG